MPGVMDPYVPHSGLSENRLPGPPVLGPFNRTTMPRGEDQVVIHPGVSRPQPFGCLPLAVLLKQLQDRGRALERKLALALAFPKDDAAVAARDRVTHGLLAGMVAAVRPGLGLGPEAERPVRPVRDHQVRLRVQHGPVRGRPAHARGLPARAVHRRDPARQPRQAQRGDHRRGQRPRPARPGAGVGEWDDRGRRRHSRRNLAGQSAGGDLDPVREGRRDRLPPRFGPVCRVVHPFHPCGVWEAVYIIEGLLRNASEVQPKVVHADTQGQSFPIYTLAHLMGFELMPRVRNWKGLIFYRPAAETVYTHIDALFGEPGRNVIDWDLIETHFRDLMRVAISIREGKVSSATLMRRLSSNSRRNHVYQAFREVGRVIRTVQLLRFLSDAPLRRRVTAATNKVESYNGFAQWLQFGKRGVLGDNDPDEQEKLMKFNQLLANCVIFHNTLDMMDVIRQLQAEGHTIEAHLEAHLRPSLVRAGTDLVTVAELLGHASLENVRIYTRPSEDDKIKALDNLITDE